MGNEINGDNEDYLGRLGEFAGLMKSKEPSLGLLSSFPSIETSPNGVLKRPSYHVMRLYATHAKPIPVPLRQSSDILDLFACASENNTSLVIFGVNSATEPVKATFTLGGFPRPVRLAGAEAVCDVLDARQADVVNHWNIPERVKARRLETEQSEVVFPALSAAAIDCAAF